MKNIQRYLLTGSVVLITALLVLYKYYEQVINPWTRDGQVAAQVIEIAPRVSGPVIKLNIKDNQFVKKGEILFKIDPSVYETKLEYAEANLQNVENELVALDKEIDICKQQVKVFTAKMSEARALLENSKVIYDESLVEFERKTKLLKDKVIARREYDVAKAVFEEKRTRYAAAKTGLVEAKYELASANDREDKAISTRGKLGKDNAKLRLAKASLELAKLNLKYTNVIAPVNGYISNLQLYIGSQAIAEKSMLALIDSSSYWVYGFFQEDEVGNMRIGDKAVVTLMGYADWPLEAEVLSIGWGIARSNGSKGNNLLANVSPTFEWIRLAQRIPVRIKLKSIPENVKLRIGTTASVLVRTSNK